MLNTKKGETVILKGFTGIKLGVFEVTAADKKTITITKRDGNELIFDRKTGKQVNIEEGKEKYANSVMEDDGSYVAPSTRGASKKKAAKAATKPAKKSAPVEEEDDDEDEDDEEEEVKPVKKNAKKPAPKAPAKKPAKKAPVVEDDDDEDDDDDDFEEVDD